MIAVTDNGSDKIPVPSALNPDAETGRGLGLVEFVAARWGHCGGRHGRTVWFELRWTCIPLAGFPRMSDAQMFSG